MRVTFVIDDDIYEAVRGIAATERTSVSKVLSSLVRRSLSSQWPTRPDHGFPVFNVPRHTRVLTAGMVRAALGGAG